MTENVINILKANPWSVATTNDEEVNVVPVGFKNVTPDGKLIIGDIMMDTTIKNIQANGKVSISAFDPKSSEGYQVKGTAEYQTEGPVLEKLNETAKKIFPYPVVVKGAVVITPAKVIVTTPGPDNKKEI